MTATARDVSHAGERRTHELITLRRRLHAHPELRFEQTSTIATLRAALVGGADEVITGLDGHCLVARVDGDRPGVNVLIRADIDALPIQDQKDVEYRSQNPGVAHACGHDVHATVGVGLLRRLFEKRLPAGSVTVVFQPAEETPFGATSGAAAVLESGILGSTRYAAVLGVHCWPDLPAGVIGLEPTISMAAKDAFQIHIAGAAAHAATPEAGRDAVAASAALVGALHVAISRRRNPQELVAFNVGTINGGSSQSVVAQDVVVTGTLRTHDEAVRQRLRTVIAQATSGTAVQHDVTCTITWANEMPAVANAGHLVALARTALPATATVDLPVGPMTSDDFALYRGIAPLLYLKLGVAGKDIPGPPLHSARFDVAEECIGTGVAALTSLCEALVA